MVAAPIMAYENIYTITWGTNHGLCSAGISVVLWISGFSMLTQIKTVAISVLNAGIQLYLYLA
jgi:hypothetical protein